MDSLVLTKTVSFLSTVAIKSYRYRCVWRKVRRINRFRAFSSPDFFSQTIDANRCFRASAPIRTGHFPFSGRCVQPAPFFSGVFPAGSGIFLKKESQILGCRFVGFDEPKKRRPFSISKRALAAASETAGRRRPLRPYFLQQEDRSHGHPKHKPSAPLP